MIKFCKKCQEEKNKRCPSGYSFWWKDSVTQCPNCGGHMIDIDFPAKDLAIIEEISEDTAFIEAMIKLKETDPIEYQLKLSQFKNQVQQKSSEQNKNILKCPTCQATNIKKIARI